MAYVIESFPDHVVPIDLQRPGQTRLIVFQHRPIASILTAAPSKSSDASNFGITTISFPFDSTASCEKPSRSYPKTGHLCIAYTLV